MIAEEERLREARDGREDWRLWGPYLAERSWGTVREDYSVDGAAWEYFPHDHARSRAYRWCEDGIAGICDRQQFLCFALALWNGQDPILKERLFGLTGNEGNHGEDAKEYWYYLDNTPTHSYMNYLYKYPQRAFPYARLVEENARRGRRDPEFELLDTGVFDENRYFDVTVEYAKAAPDDVLIQVSASNRGPDPAELHLLPTLWFRNTWAWLPGSPRPQLSVRARSLSGAAQTAHREVVRADHKQMGTYYLLCRERDAPELLFTENDTNVARLYGERSASDGAFVKDAFHEHIVHGNSGAVNPAREGTKAAAHYRATVDPGGTWVLRLRLCRAIPHSDAFGQPFDEIMDLRQREADDFYATVAPEGLSDDAQRVQRQALAGMLWSKQYYHFNVRKWLAGDPGQPPPPQERRSGRNSAWPHLDNDDVLSMPDKWEYPWYAAWDLAFHCIALSLVDSDFAKSQLVLLLREWYMHPNGQVPAYEWSFGDVNPPVHAWAALRVYQIDRRLRGDGDTAFLERVFHKLLLNFTWWVNRKDATDRNVFQGGFLGLDNIGIFDRSQPLPDGGLLDQSDGTSWMATYCLNMLAIALELARHDGAYEDVATKFLEHFFYIAHAMNTSTTVCGEEGIGLWDDEDGFYYDVLRMSNSSPQFVRARSLVGLIPTFAVQTLDAELLNVLPNFKHHLKWFLENRPDLCQHAASVERPGRHERRLFSIVDEDRLRAVLSRMLDESEFLSPYGIRSVSRYHRDHPFQLKLDGQVRQVDYEPAESTTDLFGGNSNWRGPVWFPLNYLIIESLQKFDYYYGDKFKVECPTGSGRMLTLWEVATELSQRLIRLFLRDEDGRRPVFGGTERLQSDPHWRDLIPYHEYFHGDDGAGLGASHQTGWTGLVAKLIQQSGS